MTRHFKNGRLLCIPFLASVSAAAGPIDFGLNEYNAAIGARNLKWKVKYELTPDPAETYRIEPYAYGGAHVTGGDLRGLMYGLLEAADQIRATGRLKQARGEPATPLRGVRMFARAADLEAPDAFWRSYFETLARDRFNHFALIVEAGPNFERLRAISQLAADYAIEFTLGFWEHQANENLKKLLAACPLIRSLQIRTDSKDVDAYRNAVFKPLRDAGRRIALDPQGNLLQAEFLKAAEQTGVALRGSAPSWPASFDLDLPREFEKHASLYWLWGRAAYDPKVKPPHGENPEEFHAAAQITTLIAALQAADPQMFAWPEAIRPAAEESAPANDWISTIPEAVGARLEHSASAKRTTPEIADALLASAATLDKTAVPDFQLLARLARFHAHGERAAYEIELFDRTKDAAALDRAEKDLHSANSYFPVSDSRVADRRQANGISSGGSIPAAPKRLLRPQIRHSAVKSAAPDQPINVTLEIANVKDAGTVRLHYRAADSAGPSNVIEKPAATSLPFTIPGAPSDIIYYFEILNRESTGWFEPDPDLGKPYHLVRIEPK